MGNPTKLAIGDHDVGASLPAFAGVAEFGDVRAAPDRDYPLTRLQVATNGNITREERPLERIHVSSVVICRLQDLPGHE
jgi:hypothetical protein